MAEEPISRRRSTPLPRRSSPGWWEFATARKGMNEQNSGMEEGAKKILECVACWGDTWASVRTKIANGSKWLVTDW